MPEIKVLPEAVVAKIAAGEVIERPASVLKELIENSLDAGAARIEVEIRKAGRGLIRVRDDGRGMEREDLRLALGRHATSKLGAFDDLYALSTFGFRGEALYSVFAVSRLKLISCRAGAASGYELQGEGGHVAAELPAPPVKGTTVEVADLFFNTPARAKFMKSDNSERAALIRVVEEAALANPGTAFRLNLDGEEKLNLPLLPGGDWENLKHRAAEIFGRAVYGGLLRVEGERQGLRVRGFASRADALGASKQNQYFFVNRRPVASALLRQALYRGYGGLLVGKHPACALLLETDPAAYDANVHPQKRDVKFSGEGEVFSLVSGAVSAQVLAGQTPEVRFAAAQPASGPARFAAPDVPAYREAAPLAAVAAPAAEAAPLFGGDLPPPADAAPSAFPEADWRSKELRYIGQLDKSYLLFESAGGLLVADQHAAQERVLYEKYLGELGRGEIKVQPLLVPVEAELSRSQMETVLRWREWLKTAGFEIDQRGPAVALLRSSPALFYFSQPAFASFIGYLSDVLGDPGKAAEDLKRDIIATMACKKSVKAHDALKPQEAMRLMEDLKHTKDSYHCPHGRPTLFYLSAAEIGRRFQRGGAV